MSRTFNRTFAVLYVAAWVVYLAFASPLAKAQGCYGPACPGEAPQTVALASDFSESAATLTNTALSFPVTHGRKYKITGAIFLSEAVFADGAKMDFGGGTATATTFLVTCNLTQGVVGSTTSQTAANQTTLAGGTVVAALTNGSTHLYNCVGYLEPATSGTFIFRAAQNAHTTGTLLVKAGSWIQLEVIR